MTNAEATLSKLRGQSIALVGLGVENLALARFLIAGDCRFTVCDLGATRFDHLKEEWKPSAADWSLGPEYLDDLQRFDVAFRTPGISPLRPELLRARDRGTEVSSQTRLFFELSPAPILAVTGTKGKGTTVSLVAEMLRRGPYRSARAGGNIGLPPISFVDELDKRDLVILELSSFQLQDMERSPAIAVVLAISADHLDYHADIREYVAAKSAITRFQAPEDWVIFDGDCEQSSAIAAQSPGRSLGASIEAPLERGFWADDQHLWRRLDGEAEAVCGIDRVRLRGRHNLANIAAAAAAATAAALRGNRPMPTAQLQQAIADFAGLPHRLELVGTYSEIDFVNDSLGTTPSAASAAVKAFEEPVVLIAGGASKGADFSELATTLQDAGVRGLVLIGEEATRIAEAIERAGGISGKTVQGCETMSAAVAAARNLAQRGDVVLLSPGCSSFDMFANYADRGERFKAAAAERSAG